MTTRFKTAALALIAPATLLTAIPAQAGIGANAPAVASQATEWHHGDRGWGGRGWEGRGRGDYYGRGYDRDYRYDEPVYANTRTWRGDDGRYYCRRSDGTTGLLIGGVAGALIGREVAGRRGDRTLGAILGAAGGALLGRAVERSSNDGGYRCR